MLNMSDIQLSDNANLWRKLRNKLRHLLRLNSNGTLEESVVELIEEHNSEGTKITVEEREMLHNVLGFGDLKVSEIMIPRSDIDAIPVNITFDELKEVLIDKEHTRMPVYQDNLDNVIGFIHIKDLVPMLIGIKPFVISEILRQILVISPSMKLIDLLAKMRSSCVHIALVLDEYGGTDGMVTIENIVEEITGEINDEHDEGESAPFRKLPNGDIETNSRLKIHKLEYLFGIKIEQDEDFDTVGGLILSLTGKLPEAGQIIYHESGVVFEIIERDSRRINKLLIRKP